MNDGLPPPVSPFGDPATFANYRLQVMRVGYERTMNGFFVFWSIDTYLEAIDRKLKVEAPVWALAEIRRFTEGLASAKGVTAIAGAIRMRARKTSAQGATEAREWFGHAMEARIVRELLEAIKPPISSRVAREIAAAALSHIGQPTTPEALRKRIERLKRKPVSEFNWPADPFGRTTPK